MPPPQAWQRPGTYLVYSEAVQTLSLTLRDVSVVPPMSLMLFGGRLSFNAKASLLALDDGWIRFKVAQEVAAVIQAGRRQLDAIFDAKMARPDADLSKERSALIEVITKLIANHSSVGL